MSRLRILMVSHVPLVAELGAGRVQLELADELRQLGHEVELFDVVEARRFGRGRFAARAASYVRANARRFDVVDAQHGALPFTKRELGFDGLLVARSCGLYSFYLDFIRESHRRWPQLVPGSRAAQALHRWRSTRHARDCRRSLETCDLALLLTRDEVEWVERELGRSSRWTAMPNGLSDAHATALGAAALPPPERLARREVTCVGSWSLRKGSADWPEIVQRVRTRVPDARFTFVGTGSEPDELRIPGVSVVPSFRPTELPRLLAGAAVGASAAYTEGWGLGLLEQLAAGLPSVAYDVSGPRALLRDLDPTLLVTRGDAAALAARLADLLVLDEPRYRGLAAQGVRIADRYRWAGIARETAALYVRAFAALGEGRAVAA